MACSCVIHILDTAQASGVIVSCLNFQSKCFKWLWDFCLFVPFLLLFFVLLFFAFYRNVLNLCFRPPRILVIFFFSFFLSPFRPSFNNGHICVSNENFIQSKQNNVMN